VLNMQVVGLWLMCCLQLFVLGQPLSPIHHKLKRQYRFSEITKGADGSLHLSLQMSKTGRLATLPIEDQKGKWYITTSRLSWGGMRFSHFSPIDSGVMLKSDTGDMLKCEAEKAKELVKSVKIGMSCKKVGHEAS